MSFKERLGRAIMRADSQDLAVIEELCKQRAELLEALKIVQSSGSYYMMHGVVVDAVNKAITKAEAAE